MCIKFYAWKLFVDVVVERVVRDRGKFAKVVQKT